MTTRNNFPVFAVFILSGMAALIYQIVWQRSLFVIFGSNSESVTIIVAAFMLGLGVGSLLGGEITRNPERPLIAYFAVIELATAIFGAVSIEVFRMAGTVLSGTSLLVTAVGSLALICIPTTLMGATLPMLVTHCVQRDPHVGKSVSWLYFANTLGAALACFMVALFLLERSGQQGATFFAALLNVTVAALAWVYLREKPEQEAA